MGTVYAVANQKGGVGKTTTAVNLGASVADAGHSTLLVDLDPQCNATVALGLPKDLSPNIYDVVVGDEISAAEVGDLFPPARTDDVLAGFYVPQDGRANPVDVTMALAKGARMRGVSIVEGVPVTDAESGLIDWPVVTASSIRTVEAMRGPGASMYGDSAVGGVLQVLTNRGQGAYVNMSAGSFGTYLADGSSGRRFARIADRESPCRLLNPAYGALEAVPSPLRRLSNRGFRWARRRAGSMAHRQPPGQPQPVVAGRLTAGLAGAWPGVAFQPVRAPS